MIFIGGIRKVQTMSGAGRQSLVQRVEVGRLGVVYVTDAIAGSHNCTAMSRGCTNFQGLHPELPGDPGRGRTRIQQKRRIAYDQAQTQQKEVEQMLKLGYEKAKSDFDFSIEEYATAKSNLNLAERIEKKQQIKFKEGLSTSFEFSEAQRQLYATQQTYLQSMVDIINKKAAFEKLTIK